MERNIASSISSTFEPGIVVGNFIDLAAAEAGVLHGGGNLAEARARGARR